MAIIHIPHGPVRSLLALFLGLGIGIGFYLLASQWEGSVEYAKGRDLPGTELVSLSGVGQPLKSIAAERPAVLVVFSSWCRYCKPVLRSMMQLQELAASENVGLYAVNYGESAEQVQRLKESMELDMPILLDEDKQFAAAMGIDSIPVVYGVAQGGEIRYSANSLPPDQEWPAFLQKLK